MLFFQYTPGGRASQPQGCETFVNNAGQRLAVQLFSLRFGEKRSVFCAEMENSEEKNGEKTLTFFQEAGNVWTVK